MMRTLTLALAALIAASPATASNFLLVSGGCIKPAVYSSEMDCQADGNALPGSPPYACVSHSGNNLPPPGVFLFNGFTLSVCVRS